MTTLTFTSPAADLVALAGDQADSLAKVAARLPDDARAYRLTGAWIAQGWIDASTADRASDLEEITRHRDTRLVLTEPDGQAIASLAAHVTPGRRQDWIEGACREAAAAWHGYWAAGVEAIVAGRDDGAEHADDLANPAHTGIESEDASELETLRACSRESNDWGTSSSEAWALIRGDDRFGAAWKLAYCEAYEKAARERCGELAEELAAEKVA